MDNLRTTIEKNAFVVGLLTVAGYFAFFAFPALHKSQAIGHGEVKSGVDKLIDSLPTEIGLTVSILLLIVIFGWWRQAGFRKHNPGTLKFAIAPAVLTGLILAFVAFNAESGGKSILGIVGTSHMAILLLMTLLIGIFEEGLFRGVLFHGTSKKFSPLMVVLVTGVMFGGMHVVNILSGQPVPATIMQMIHAGIGGLMYGMLRLMIGAIWPVILLHAFWDATISILGATMSGLADAAETVTAATVPPSGYHFGAIVASSPELLYGAFLLYIWLKWKKNGTHAASMSVT